MNPLEIKTLCKAMPHAKYLDPLRKAVGEPSRQELNVKELKACWPYLETFMKFHPKGPKQHEFETFVNAYFHGNVQQARKYLEMYKHVEDL